MALFKIARGPSNALGTLPTQATEGFAYFQPYDGSFYIDIATANQAVTGYSTADDATANRIKIAAGIADKVGHSLTVNGKTFNGSTDIDVGTIAVNKGGTGKTSWTQYGVLYASAKTTLAQVTAAAGGAILVTGNSKAPTWLAAGNAGDILKSNSTTGAPEWIDPTTSLTAYNTSKTLYFYAADASGADAPTGTNSVSFNGSADKSISTKTINALNKAGGTMTGTVYFASGTAYYIDSAGCAKFNSLDTTGATNLGSTLSVTGATTLSSTLAVTGATTLSSTLVVTGIATMYHVIPADDNTTYELGSATARWKKLHIGTADTYGSATQPIWWSDGKPAECTSYANAVVKSAGEFTSAQSITLTGDVTGTASSKAGWSITATVWKMTPHEHDATYVAAATAPTDYDGKLIFTGMKTNATIGITSELTYSYVIGLRGYSSKDGGGSHEFAFNDNAIYHRMSSTGADTWGSWNMLVRSAAGSAVGSATQPVWINSAGIITACTSYANASVNYATTAGSANAVAWANVTDKPATATRWPTWDEVTSKPSTFTPSTHLQAIANGGTSATTAQDATWNLLHVANPGDLNNAKRMGNFKISNTTTNVPVSGMWGATWNIVDDAAAGNNGTSGSTWQLVFQSASNSMWLRCITNEGNWTAYAKFLSDKNYTDYTVTKTGSGASGSWGISVTGSAGSVAWANVTGKPSTFAPASHTHNYAGSASAGGAANSANILNAYASIGSSTTDHGVALKNWFTSNKSTAPRNSIISFYSSTSGNGSQYMGYFLSGYADNPYGGFFVCHYNNPYYVGISNGTYTQQHILTSTNYTSYTVTKTGSGASGTWGISISGNAATATSATKATQDASGNTITNKYFQIYNTSYQGNTSAVTVNDLAAQGPAYGMINAATDNPTGGATWVHVLNMAWGKTNASWIGQIALHTNGATMYFRGNGSSAISGKGWNTVLSSNNYTSYTVTKTGSGASGTWGINVTGSSGSCTGNAATATTASGANVLNINNTMNLSSCLQYIQTSAQTGNNDLHKNAWCHCIKMNHGNGGTYYKRVVSFDFWGQNNVYTATAEGNGSTTAWKKFWIQGDSVTSAVWNDYAEYRESSLVAPGQCVYELGDDTLAPTTERLQPAAGIVSDTWGFSQGETETAKTPIAVAGRVLAYAYRCRDEYKPGDALCAAPGGTVDIMTREEIMQYPDRIVGIVSCIPTYEEWGGGADRDPIDVDGRIWIKVR